MMEMAKNLNLNVILHVSDASQMTQSTAQPAGAMLIWMKIHRPLLDGKDGSFNTEQLRRTVSQYLNKLVSRNVIQAALWMEKHKVLMMQILQVSIILLPIKNQK